MTLTGAVISLILGGALMIFGGEILVRGAVKLAILFGISPLVVGLTIVAVCTSAPELAVSLAGIFGDQAGSDIALGNVVGSNTYNALFILGVTSLCFPLVVSSSLIKKEIPILIGLSALTWLLTLGTTRVDDKVSHVFPQWGGILFVALLAIYFIQTILAIRVNKDQNVEEEFETQYGAGDQSGKSKKGVGSVFLIATGLAMLVIGSNRCVDGAIATAQFFKISELTISLTILAAGTSLPELVVSMVAAARGRTDIAVGNIIGSNIFNLLGILGLSAILIPGGLPVSSQAFRFDIPAMILVTVVTGLFCASGRRLCRREGFILLVCYIAYVTTLLTVFNPSFKM